MVSVHSIKSDSTKNLNAFYAQVIAVKTIYDKMSVFFQIKQYKKCLNASTWETIESELALKAGQGSVRCNVHFMDSACCSSRRISGVTR